MSYADKTFMAAMALTLVITLLVLWILFSTPLRKRLTVQSALAALAATPVAQLLLFLVVDQVPRIGLHGLLAGDFMCGGVHGAGYRGGCSLYEAIFEAVIASVVFSFISLGLAPLAVFAVLLLLFALMKRAKLM